MDHKNGSRSLDVIEDAWSEIMKRHPDVPPPYVTQSRATQFKGNSRWGHFSNGEVWKVADGEEVRMFHELMVTGEAVDDGPRALLKTLLHEAAHGMARVRGIEDTSNAHRYHNHRFVILAEELGLQRPREPHPVIGWSNCRLRDETADEYADVLTLLQGANLGHVDASLARSLIAEADRRKMATEDRKKVEKWAAEFAGGTKKARKVLEEFGIESMQDIPRAEGEEFSAFVDRLLDAKYENPSRAGRRMAVVCRCTPPRRTQVTPAFLDGGPILCGTCMHPFAVKESAA